MNSSQSASCYKGAKNLSGLTPGNGIGHPLPRTETASQKLGPVPQAATLKPGNCLYLPWNRTCVYSFCPLALGSVEERLLQDICNLPLTHERDPGRHGDCTP